MRRVKPSRDPERGTDRAVTIVVLVAIVLAWMAHCTPLGKLPEPQSAVERWRERA